jgi:poly(3-hydroxybutyrate) depolymerase
MSLSRPARLALLALLASIAACAAEPVPFATRSGSASRDQAPADGETPTDGETAAPPDASSTPGAPTATAPSTTAPAPGGNLTAGDRTLTKTVAGLPRTIPVHVPTSITQRKLPVVLALHGNGDQATNFIATSGLLQLADSVGFVLVAPQGVSRAISVGGQTTPPLSWDAYNARAQNADVQLFDALLDELVASGSVDTKKIVVYGYSQGGYASVRYGREGAARLACAAVIAAADAGGVPTAFPRKLPFSIQIGSTDGARNGAASLAQSLQNAGHPVDFHEIAGAGHSPLPGPARAPLDDCLARALP